MSKKSASSATEKPNKSVITNNGITLSFKDVSAVLEKYLLYAKKDLIEKLGDKVPEHITKSQDIANYLVRNSDSKAKLGKVVKYIPLSEEVKIFLVNIVAEFIQDCLKFNETPEKQVELKSINLINYNTNDPNAETAVDKITKINELNKAKKLLELCEKNYPNSMLGFILKYNLRYDCQYGKSLHSGSEGFSNKKYLEIKLTEYLKGFKNDNPYAFILFYGILNKFMKNLAYQFADISIDTKFGIDCSVLKMFLRYNNIDAKLFDKLVPPKKERKPRKQSDKSASKSTDQSAVNSSTNSTTNSSADSSVNLADNSTSIDSIMSQIFNKVETESESDSETENEDLNDNTQQIDKLLEVAN